jgi:nitrite reductase/ring-hydroxylating ferredoxin subunit
MTRHVICKESELPPGGKRIIDAGGKSIGVFNIGGEYYALRNMCPHQFAPLCEGKVTGYCEPSPPGEFRWTRQGEIIRCPWHGWEFDIKTGRSIFNPHKVRTKSYETAVEPAADSGSTDAEGVETFPVEVCENMVVVYT